MMRDDISNNLVHLTKGTGVDIENHRKQAVLTLVSILKSGELIGGSGMIKGSHKCVCFSEAPISKLSYLIASKEHKNFKYQPYGILVNKQWLYSRGGRPVIYGPDADYSKLPPEMRFRHVRFYLGNDYNVDHTWEREWRIKTKALKITPEAVTIVTPDRFAMDAFQKEHPKWHYMALSDLGVEIDALKNG